MSARVITFSPHQPTLRRSLQTIGLDIPARSLASTTPLIQHLEPRHSPRHTPISSFESLVEDLCTLLSHSSGHQTSEIDHKGLQLRMQKYKTYRAEWARYALEDPETSYTRSLIDRPGGWANLLLLVWKPGMGSAVHDHAGSHCIMKVLQGTLEETLYDWPAPGQPPLVRQQRSLTEDAVGYMSDEVGLHKICNASDSQPAVSLHLYTPPWAEQRGCHVYGEASGNVSLVKQRYFSEYGRICGDQT